MAIEMQFSIEGSKVIHKMIDLHLKVLLLLLYLLIVQKKMCLLSKQSITL